MVVFGWNFLPSELLNEDERLMDDILTISMVNGWLQPADQATLRAKFE